MDGFRDRMGRSSDRYDRYDENRYDRAERGARRSSYNAAPQGLSADEVNQIVDDSNAKQIDVINDFFEDVKDDLFETEKQILNAIDSLHDKLDNNEKEEIEIPEKAVDEVNETEEAILREVRENSDLLAQFAEEQLPMLVRGNSSMLSQISESLEEKGELLRDILDATNNQPSQPSVPVMPAVDSNSEEVLQTVINNNTLLNSLRAEVAGIQGELRDAASKQHSNHEDDNSPLDAVPVTKEEVGAFYSDMEEHVHKECVKVYKNVQAALETQNATVAETVKAGGGGTKILLAFNLVLLLLNLAITIAHVLDFI